MDLDPHGWPSRDGSVIIGEFDVPSVPGNERQAAERVVAMLRHATAGCLDALHPSRLEELKTAVAEAVLNAMEHGNQYHADLPVSVRVIGSGEALIVRIADRGVGGMRLHLPSAQGAGPQSTGAQVQVPDLMAKLAGEQPPRGWGLYLIAQMTDDVRILDCEGEHVVELLWYLGEAGEAGER
jgi:anti-sigma regulatory factor (Ser/Thr protein kinase)